MRHLASPSKELAVRSYHSTIYEVLLPDWIPQEIHTNMEQTFQALLRVEFNRSLLPTDTPQFKRGHGHHKSWSSVQTNASSDGDDDGVLNKVYGEAKARNDQRQQA
jgi:hypothetical protein